MKNLLVLILLTSFFLPSCNNTPESIVEEIAPTILYYFEKGETEKYRVTTMVPPVKNEKRVVISTEETMLKDIKNKLNSEYFRDVRDGQLRLVFFSEDLAQDEGIRNIINSLYMDPSISDRIFLGIVKGEFKNILYKNGLTDYFLYKEMRHNENSGSIIVVDMHQYLKAFNSTFADPFLPYFVIEGEEMHYQGVALMKNHRNIHTISLQDTKFFVILLNNAKYQDIVPIKSLKVTIGLVNSEFKITMDNKNKIGHLNVKLKGIVSEYQGERDLSNQKEQLILKEKIEKEIYDQILSLLKIFQEEKIDPIHLGLYTKRLFSQPYQGDEWKKEWPNYNINLNVDLDIKDYGTYQKKEKEREEVF